MPPEVYTAHQRLFNTCPSGYGDGARLAHPTGSTFPPRACHIAAACDGVGGWGVAPAYGARAGVGTFLMFPEHCKPLWRVFPNACGWSPEAFG